MAKGKKTFIFYSDWINMVREMPNADAGELLKHILSYVNDENPTTENLLVRMAFGHMKPMIKSDLVKWENIRETRSLAGKKGGEANAKQKKANAKQLEAVNVNVNVNENVNVNIESRKADFKKEILLYQEKYSLELLEGFFLYWSEHGKNDRKMKFEKQKSFAVPNRLATWKRNESKFGNTSSSTSLKETMLNNLRELQDE